MTPGSGCNIPYSTAPNDLPSPSNQSSTMYVYFNVGKSEGRSTEKRGEISCLTKL